MDETVIMNEQANVESNNETMPNEKRRWKQVVVGGVSGILMGTVSSAAYAATSNHLHQQAEVESEQNAEESANDVVETQEYIDGVIPVAEVDDSMSFGEAFAAAREQVGPGGVFVWHGQLYGTYTATEWNSMTPAEHAEFGSHLNIVYDESDSHDVVDDGRHENNEHNNDEHQNNEHNNDGHEHNEATDHQPQQVIEVLGYESGVVINGATVDIATVNIDGKIGHYIDLDHNHIADFLAIDANEDGVLTNDEYTNVSDSVISMPTMGSGLAGDNDLAYNHDYINDGNIDSYV